MKTFSGFNNLKNEISAYIDDAISIFEASDVLKSYNEDNQNDSSAECTGFHDTVCILLNQKERLQSGVFKILVVGEFSTGKSTFLNALMGTEALPVGIRPTTSAINIIRHSEEPRVVVRYWGEFNEINRELSVGETEDISLEDLMKYSTSISSEYDRISKKVKLIELYIPNDYCKNSVEILDTPGLASTNEYHEKITLDYLPNGNACIMLLNPNQPMSRSERDYLKVVRHFVSKVFFVANKIDLLDDDERQEALEYMNSELLKELDINDNITIYPMNAKEACKQGWHGTGLDVFAQELERFLTSDQKALELILPPARIAKEHIGFICDDLSLRAHLLEFTPDEFQERMNEILPRLQEIEEDKDLLQGNFELMRQNTILTLHKELDAELDKWQYSGAAFIDRWQGDITELSTELSNHLKQELVGFAAAFQSIAENHLNQFMDNTKTRMKRMEKKIRDLQIEYSSENISKIKISIYMKPDDLNGMEVSDVYSFGHFAIGALSGLMIGGPLGLIVTLAGSHFLSKRGEEQKQQKQLEAVKSKFFVESDKKKEAIRKTVLNSVEKQIKHYEKSVSESINAMIVTTRRSLSDIEKEMQNKKEELDDKRKKLMDTVAQLDLIYTGIGCLLNKAR